MLHEELVLLERDLARLEAEATPTAAAAVLSAERARATPPASASAVPLPSPSTAASAYLSRSSPGSALLASHTLQQRAIVSVAAVAAAAGANVSSWSGPSPNPNPNQLSSFTLLSSLKKHSRSRVLVADLAHFDGLVLMPSARELAQAAMASAAFGKLSKQLLHARGCLKALSGADALLAPIGSGAHRAV